MTNISETLLFRQDSIIESQLLIMAPLRFIKRTLIVTGSILDGVKIEDDITVNDTLSCNKTAILEKGSFIPKGTILKLAINSHLSLHKDLFIFVPKDLIKYSTDIEDIVKIISECDSLYNKNIDKLSNLELEIKTKCDLLQLNENNYQESLAYLIGINELLKSENIELKSSLLQDEKTIDDLIKNEKENISNMISLRNELELSKNELSEYEGSIKMSYIKKSLESLNFDEDKIKLIIDTLSNPKILSSFRNLEILSNFIDQLTDDIATSSNIVKKLSTKNDLKIIIDELSNKISLKQMQNESLKTIIKTYQSNINSLSDEFDNIYNNQSFKEENTDEERINLYMNDTTDEDTYNERIRDTVQNVKKNIIIQKLANEKLNTKISHLKCISELKTIISDKEKNKTAVIALGINRIIRKLNGNEGLINQQQQLKNLALSDNLNQVITDGINKIIVDFNNKIVNKPDLVDTKFYDILSFQTINKHLNNDKREIVDFLMYTQTQTNVIQKHIDILKTKIDNFNISLNILKDRRLIVVNIIKEYTNEYDEYKDHLQSAKNKLDKALARINLTKTKDNSKLEKLGFIVENDKVKYEKIKTIVESQILNIDIYNHELVKIDDSINEIKMFIEQTNLEINKYLIQIELLSKNENISSEKYNFTQSEIKDILEVLEEYRLEHSDLKEKISELTQSNIKLTNELHNNKIDNNELSEKSLNEIESNIKTNSVLSETITQNNLEINELSTKLTFATEEINRFKLIIETLQDNISSVTNKHDEQKVTLFSKIKQYQTKLLSIKQMIDPLSVSSQETKSSKDTLIEDLVSLSESFVEERKKFIEDYNILNEKYNELKNDYSSLTDKHTEFSSLSEHLINLYKSDNNTNVNDITNYKDKINKLCNFISTTIISNNINVNTTITDQFDFISSIFTGLIQSNIDLAKNVNNLEENNVEKNDLVYKLKSEIDNVNTDNIKLGENYSFLNNEYNQLKNENDELTESNNQLQTKLKSVINVHEDFKNNIIVKTKELEINSKKMYNELQEIQAENEQLIKENENYKKLNTESEKLTYVMQENDSLKTKIHEINNECSSLKIQVDEFKNKNDELNSNILELNNKISPIETIVNKLYETIDTYEKTKRDYQTKILNLNNQINDLSLLNSKLIEEESINESKINELTEKLHNNVDQASLSKIEAKIEELITINFHLENEKKTLLSNINILELELKNSKSNEDLVNANTEIKILRNKHSINDEDIDKLKAENNMLRSELSNILNSKTIEIQELKSETDNIKTEAVTHLTNIETARIRESEENVVLCSLVTELKSKLDDKDTQIKTLLYKIDELEELSIEYIRTQNKLSELEILVNELNTSASVLKNVKSFKIMSKLASSIQKMIDNEEIYHKLIDDFYNNKIDAIKFKNIEKTILQARSTYKREIVDVGTNYEKLFI